MATRIMNSFDDQTVISMQFNQDYSSLMLGTHCGYSLINTLDENFPEEFQTGGQKVFIIERLFSSSLLTMVPLEETKKLNIYHFKKRMLICHFRYSTSILAVKMNRQRLIVCVEDGIFIHNVHNMEMQHKVEEVVPNRRGIVALSSNEENCYFAYPGSSREGSVVIFDAMNFQAVNTIVAHNGLLAAMTFNQSGHLLATASEKGTVIRVFAIPSGNRVMEFRRGLARFATINSLSFSLDDSFLVAASNTETVHIFRLDTKREAEGGVVSDLYHPGGASGGSGVSISASNNNRRRSGSGGLASGSSPPDPPFLGGGDPSELPSQPAAGGGGWLDWIGGTIKQTASYLPSQFSEIITQDRAFAFAHLSPVSAEVQKIAAIVNHNRLPRLLVASLDGYLNVFAIDPINGGEAQLVKTINLLVPREASDTSNSAVRGSVLLTSPVGGSASRGSTGSGGGGQQQLTRRHRGESSSSVDSGGTGVPISSVPSQAQGYAASPPRDSSGSDTLPSYSTDETSNSFIKEGLHNLRLQDQAEFPALPKKH